MASSKESYSHTEEAREHSETGGRQGPASIVSSFGLPQTLCPAGRSSRSRGSLQRCCRRRRLPSLRVPLSRCSAFHSLIDLTPPCTRRPAPSVHHAGSRHRHDRPPGGACWQRGGVGPQGGKEGGRGENNNYCCCCCCCCFVFKVCPTATEPATPPPLVRHIQPILRCAAVVGSGAARLATCCPLPLPCLTTRT